MELLVIFLGYLLGSIPTAYLAGKWIKGIDMRHYGSGTISGSMVYEHVGRLWVVPVGLFDIAKGAIPAWLALKLGYGEDTAALAGLAATVGHNWPLFLKFTGGRGISPFLGLLVVLFPWGAPWLLGFLAVGYALGDSAPFTLAGMSSLPLLVYRMKGAPELYWMIGIMLVITFIKRLEANRRPLPPTGLERRKVIWLRLVFDRDIPNHKAWIQRKL
jgi:glycerol-3-phosphate acyltransferase PlsY